MMYVTVALLEKKVAWRDAARNWIISFFANFAGALFVAGALCYACDFFEKDPFRAYATKLADTKIGLGWGTALLRGVGCNWLVCMSLFMAVASQEAIGKLVALWWPIFAFVTVGFEHSVANMFMVPAGIFEGDTKYNFGEFLGRNLIPVTIGNMIGGALFVGFAEWYAYSHYFGPQVKTLDTQPGYKAPTTPALVAATRKEPMAGDAPRVELPEFLQQDRKPEPSPQNGFAAAPAPAPERRVDALPPSAV
jgi:formate/nitrite transporter